MCKGAWCFLTLKRCVSLKKFSNGRHIYSRLFPLLVHAYKSVLTLFLLSIHQIQRISLNTMTLNISSPNVYTKLGVAVNVNGVAQVSFFVRDGIYNSVADYNST